MCQTAKEIENAVRFYEGDVSWWNGPPAESNFWTDTHAYGTLNAFFFDDLTNERARIAENKYLNAAFFDDPERLLTICELLVAAARCNDRSAADLCTFRVERLTNFQEMKQAGHTIALTSTSKAGFIDEYKDKRQLVLLHFSIGSDTPCIDMQQVLSLYLKSDEQEILLPPFLPLNFIPRPLTSAEQSIRDFDGLPPVAAYEAAVGVPVPTLTPAEPFPAGGAQAGKRVFRALKNCHEPDTEDVSSYCAWKKAFRAQVRHRCKL